MIQDDPSILKAASWSARKEMAGVFEPIDVHLSSDKVIWISNGLGTGY